jgi:hypothetical protein
MVVRSLGRIALSSLVVFAATGASQRARAQDSTPAATPAPPPPPTPPVPPPGYKLVPISEPAPPQTHYNVEYEQHTGDLPPGMELPYEEGRPIPPGYRVVRQVRRGLIIPGAIVTGVLWSISLTGAVAADWDNSSGFLIIPGLGPWLMLVAGGARNHCSQSQYSYSYCDDNSGLRSVLVLDALGQTAGMALLVSGLAFQRVRVLRDDVVVSLAPMARPGTHGLSLVGTF